MTPEELEAAKNKRIGGAIQGAVGGQRVRAWLAGSTAKMDRPTLAEVEAAGFEVVGRAASRVDELARNRGSRFLMSIADRDGTLDCAEFGELVDGVLAASRVDEDETRADGFLREAAFLLAIATNEASLNDHVDQAALNLCVHVLCAIEDNGKWAGPPRYPLGRDRLPRDMSLPQLHEWARSVLDRVARLSEPSPEPAK